MRRIEADGGEDGFEFTAEELGKPLPFAIAAVAPLVALAEPNSLGFQERKQHVVEDAVLFVDEFVRDVRDATQLFRWREVVRAPRSGAQGFLLLQAGNADLEELVQDRAGDAKELESFEKRHAVALRQVEDATAELQLRQFAVDVELGTVERHRLCGVAGDSRRGALRGGVLHVAAPVRPLVDASSAGLPLRLATKASTSETAVNAKSMTMVASM